MLALPGPFSGSRALANRLGVATLRGGSLPGNRLACWFARLPVRYSQWRCRCQKCEWDTLATELLSRPVCNRCGA